MNAAQLLSAGFVEVHGAMREDLSDLADEEWWQQGGGLNTVGFLFWHAVRDEDFMISRLVLRGPELWQAGHRELLGITVDEQGTGMEPSEAKQLQYERERMWEYAEAVWKRTASALDALDPDDLARRIPQPGGDGSWTLGPLLLSGSIGHNWVHLGEIRQMRGERGWQYRE